MTKIEVQELGLKLPPEEREEVAETLLRSLDDEPLADWQEELLEERLAEHERDPESAIPGEEVLAWLRRPLE